MSPTRRAIPPLSVLFSGILFILLGILQGDAEIAIIFVVPVIYGSGIYLTIGILLIFLSFVLFFIFSTLGFQDRKPRRGIKEAGKEARSGSRSKYGGVVFIGPIPIIFGKDESIAKKMMYVGLAIAVILLFLYLLVIYN